MKTMPKPFDCEYTPQFAELLHNLGISLAISTYQAGKVIVLSAIEKDKLIQLPRTFDNPMGMATAPNSLAVATRNEVIVLRNDKNLAQGYPQKQGVYDGIYMPRAHYYTGYISMHDMEFTDNQIVGVNTLFSCLCYVNDKYSFTPFWKPPFISEQLVGEDRCHLNGLATENGKIKYISALGKTNTQQAWRAGKMNGGIVMEYPSGKIIADGLGMPHSPRIYDGKLYVLNSTQGELLKIDPATGRKQVICQLGGFARGMSRYGDYLFIGVSKLRHNSPAFRDLPIAASSFAGVIAVYLPYGSVAGSFRYQMTVDEIYDVKVLPDLMRPSLLSPNMPIHKQALSTPQQSMWGRADDKQPTNSVETPQARQTPSANSSSFNFQLIKEINAENLIAQFSNLLFSQFLKKLTNGIKGKLTAVLALQEGIPIALAVSELRNGQTAELHSIYVLPQFRRKKIANRLLEITDKVLIDNNIQYVDAVYLDLIEEKETVESLLAKNNWLPPQRTTYNIKLNNKTALKAKSFADALKRKDEVEIFEWKDLQNADIQQIKNIEAENNFPKYLTPFQIPEHLERQVSTGARIGNKIVGWCIIHKVNKNTVQCSALYVLPEHRKLFVDKKLLANSFSKSVELNIDSSIYQIQYSDKFLQRYLNSLFAPTNAIVSKYHTVALRKYYK